MNAKALLLIFLSVLLATSFITIVGAHTIYIPTSAYFGFAGNVYLNFNQSHTADLVFKSGNYWQFSLEVGNRIYTTTVNMTVTADMPPLWMNYTVSGAGQQDVYFTPNKKPTLVFLDGIVKGEHFGWDYDGGWINVTGALTAVAFYFGSTLPTFPEEDLTEGDNFTLNTQIRETFDNYYAWLDRWLQADGIFNEFYDYSKDPSNPNFKGRSWSAIGYTMYGLLSMYEVTEDPSYLVRIREFVDAAIANTTFFRASTILGEIFYAPQCFINNTWGTLGEGDITVKLTIMYGFAASKLYQITEETKYKTLADRIANETLGFMMINNSTDCAWAPDYWAEGFDPSIGVNRQSSIAAYFAYYGSLYNASYLNYVPRILHWVWRSQLANGALTYNIGDPTESDIYTAFSLWHALKAYRYYNFADAELEADMKASLNYLYNRTSFGDLGSFIVPATYMEAWKADFGGWVNASIIQDVKKFVFSSLNELETSMTNIGFVNSYGTNLGFRWGQYFIGCLFGSYPIPSSESFIQLKPVLIDEVRNKYQISYTYTLPLTYYLDDPIYYQSSQIAYPFQTSFTIGEHPTSTSFVNGTNYVKYTGSYANGSSIIYLYPSGAYVFQTSKSISSFFVCGEDLYLNSTMPFIYMENGTTANLYSLGNSTVKLGYSWILVRNATQLSSRNSMLFWNNRYESYNIIRYPSNATWIYGNTPTVIAPFRAVSLYLNSWGVDNTTKVLNPLFTHSQTYIGNNTNPVSNDDMLDALVVYRTSVFGAPSWHTNYKTATDSEELISLIGATVSPSNTSIPITNWINTNNGTTEFDVNSNGTSTVTLFCDYTPIVIGTDVFTYENQILTLTIDHSSQFIVHIIINGRPFSVLDLYIDLGIGMGGIGLMVFGPSWVAWHIKEKGFDDVTMKRIFYLMILFFVGLGMFMMWAMG